MWLACRHGAPIAKVGSYYGTGSAGTYGLATRTGARGLGIATVLMVVSMKAARDARHKLVVLHSSPLAENLYKRLGFVTFTEFHLFATEPAYLWTSRRGRRVADVRLRTQGRG